MRLIMAVAAIAVVSACAGNGASLPTAPSEVPTSWTQTTMLTTTSTTTPMTGSTARGTTTSSIAAPSTASPATAPATTVAPETSPPPPDGGLGDSIKVTEKVTIVILDPED